MRLLAITAVFFCGQAAFATTVSVSSTYNIHGSGFSSPLIFDGVSPVPFHFDAKPNQTLLFLSVTGTVNYYGGTQPSTEGPDGYGPSFYPYQPGEFPTAPYGDPGISGLSTLYDTNNAAYLVGVFLTDATPVDPAPPQLDFSNNKSFSELAPLIGQVFFIGDRLTGTGNGEIQQFHVPETATRLFLGFIDSGYSDNLGSLTATFKISSAPRGDYNGDGVVDAADYVIWRKDLAYLVEPYSSADANGNGVVDYQDYESWYNNFRAGSGSGNGAATSVPEPASILLNLVAGMLLCSLRAR